MASITVPLGQINENLTLYIATTGNDTTGDGSQGNPWLTLGQAFAWLKGRRIMNSAVVTVQLAAGTYALSAYLSLNHPDGQYINIVGADYLAYSMTSVVSSGAQSALEDSYFKYRDYVIQMSSVASIVAGDYVLIHSLSGGTLPLFIAGCHEVRSVDSGNTRITIRVYHIHASAASGAITGKVTVLKTMINTGTSYWLGLSAGCMIGDFSKIAIVNSSSRGQYGLIINNARFVATAPFAMNKTYGLLVSNSASFSCNAASVNGATMGFMSGGCSQGIYVTGSSSGANQYSIFNGGYAGIYTFFDSYVDAYASVATGCYLAGIYSGSQGYIQGQGMSIGGNNNGASGTGAVTQGNSMNYVNGASFTSNFLDMSPVVNTEGNNMSMNYT